jgi:hypothetical protein
MEGRLLISVTPMAAPKPPPITALNSREHVLAAIAEYDELGGPEFLRRHGYGPSIQYRLRHDGRTYEQKAIAGAAWGLQFFGDPSRRPESYAGGKRSSIPTLERLDFEIVDDKTARPRRPRSKGKRGGRRDSSSFHPRPFDPTRKISERRRSAPRDPESQRVAAEQADRKHQKILSALGIWLEGKGWRDLEEFDGAIDLRARRGRGGRTRVLFEIKGIGETNERGQVRSGVAQLLEYRFFLGRADDLLCLVSDQPLSRRCTEWLDELGIAHGWVADGDVHTPGNSVSTMVFAG